jgi:hypothetical protein
MDKSYEFGQKGKWEVLISSRYKKSELLDEEDTFQNGRNSHSDRYVGK